MCVADALPSALCAFVGGFASLTTKLKEADGAMVAEVMRALRWVQENHRAPMGIAAEQAEGGDSRRGSEGRGHHGECGEARRRGWAANQEGQGREGSG